MKSTLADWTVDDDDVNGFYQAEKRQRGGRKRRKKNREDYHVAQDWDDIYDPSRPNNYEEYKHSDEKIREVREWKDRLYAHRMARKNSSDLESSDEDAGRPAVNSRGPMSVLKDNSLTRIDQFAPPSAYSFAPPPISPKEDATDKVEIDVSKHHLASSKQPPQPSTLPPPPPPPTTQSAVAGVITRAPVRYQLPPPPEDLPATEEELEEVFAAETGDDHAPEATDGAPRSLRPGQKGFAERLMSKYGWTKGSGLGADGSGITTALKVQVEKRKKKPDSEGGGFADPKAIGKIIGGKRKGGKEGQTGKFGEMTETVLLKGMVDGMNLDEELGDGGLMQEIGDECGEKYGNVERVYIDRSSEEGPSKVFVKFTSQLSALRVSQSLLYSSFLGFPC